MIDRESALRAHTPQQAAGYASKMETELLHFLALRRLPAACCRELQSRPMRVGPPAGRTLLNALLIRPMTERDLDEVLVIERTSFSNPWTDVMFLAELRENPFARFLVAARDDSILGYIGGWVIVDELHLLNLAVRPDSRRRGVAGQLVDSLFRSGEGRITTASLEVRRSNQSAIALYERFGFQQVGVRPGYYADPLEDALVMGWFGEDERWRAPTEDGGPRGRLNPEGGGYV